MIIRITIEKSWRMKARDSRQTETYWNTVAAFQFDNGVANVGMILDSIRRTVMKLVTTTNSVI